MSDEQAAPPGVETNSDEIINEADWVMLGEAERLTGIDKNAIYQRIRTGSIPASDVRRANDEPKAPFLVRRSILSLLPTMPSNKRQYNRKQEAAAPANGTAPTTPDISHHVAFCAGHCTAYLEMYAKGQDIGARQLTDEVMAVMKRGGK